MKHLAFLLFLIGCTTYKQPSPISKSFDCSKLQTTILMVGDGMGPKHVEASSVFHTGKKSGFVVHNKKMFPYSGIVETNNIDGETTDSAAAATAIATGVKTTNRSVSVDKSGKRLTTVLEGYQKCGYPVGLVSTSYLLDATPAAFASHSPSRKMRGLIGEQMITVTKPDFILGGGRSLSPKFVRENGYTVITNKDELMNIKAPYPPNLAGIFTRSRMNFRYEKPSTEPTIEEMSMTAMDIMESKKSKYFLMIEGGRIDHGAHDNNIKKIVTETMAYMDTVKMVRKRVAGKKGIYLVVTADHETGGLSIIKHKGKGKMPETSFSTDWHTSTNVPIWIYTDQKIPFKDQMSNTDIFSIFHAK